MALLNALQSLNMDSTTSHASRLEHEPGLPGYTPTDGNPAQTGPSRKIIAFIRAFAIAFGLICISVFAHIPEFSDLAQWWYGWKFLKHSPGLTLSYVIIGIVRDFKQVAFRFTQY